MTRVKLSDRMSLETSRRCACNIHIQVLYFKGHDQECLFILAWGVKSKVDKRELHHDGGFTTHFHSVLHFICRSDKVSSLVHTNGTCSCEHFETWLMPQSLGMDAERMNCPMFLRTRYFFFRMRTQLCFVSLELDDFAALRHVFLLPT